MRASARPGASAPLWPRESGSPSPGLGAWAAQGTEHEFSLVHSGRTTTTHTTVRLGGDRRGLISAAFLCLCVCLFLTSCIGSAHQIWVIFVTLDSVCSQEARMNRFLIRVSKP